MSTGVPTNTRSNITLASKFLNIPCHKVAASDDPTLLDYETHDGAGTLTFEDSWNEYKAQPSGAKNVIVDDQRFDDIFNLSTLSGQLVILFTMEYSAATSATETLLQYGTANTREVPGSISLILTNTGTLSMNIRPTTNAEAVSSVSKDISAAAASAPLTVCCVIDIANGTTTIATAGKYGTATSDTDIAAITVAGILPTVTSGAFAFSIFGKHNTGGTSDGQLLNSGTGDVSISNFWAVRFETDMITDIPGICAEYNNYPAGKLWTLNGK